MMDRALGAITSSSTAPNDNTEAVNRFGMASTIHEANQWGQNTTIEELIQNPSTHYDKGDGTNLVPIASTEDIHNDWWNPETKTLYDPCPNGYRIPKHGTYGNAYSDNPSSIGWEWSGIKLTSGHTWNTTFFPTSGYRSASSGKIGGTVIYGFCWMSTPRNNTHGYNLITQKTTADPNSSHPRSFGFPTRCIAE